MRLEQTNEHYWVLVVDDVDVVGIVNEPGVEGDPSVIVWGKDEVAVFNRSLDVL